MVELLVGTLEACAAFARRAVASARMGRTFRCAIKKSVCLSSRRGRTGLPTSSAFALVGMVQAEEGSAVLLIRQVLNPYGIVALAVFFGGASGASTGAGTV